MRGKRFSLPALVLTALITLCLTLGGVLLFLSLTVGAGGLTLLQGLGYLNTLFVGEYEGERLVDGAMHGMVAATGDRWSYYMTPEQYDSQRLRRQNRYVGVGITVDYSRQEGLLLLEVTAGGPAEGAGLAVGELITAVDGYELRGEARYEGAARIQGQPGTQVVLTVLGADSATRTVTVTRGALETSAVTHRLLEGGVGYVGVSNFYDRAAQDFRAAVAELQGQAVIGLVIDMRDNGGGYLDEMTDMLDLLLPEGAIFRSATRSGREEITHSDAAMVDLPMAVLVNGGTYSAAELFAGELQERQAALVVGEPTTGKGFSQQTFDLWNGGALNFSTGKYFTGNGRSLAESGVTPDLPVSPEEGRDVQLESAANWVKNQ